MCHDLGTDANYQNLLGQLDQAGVDAGEWVFSASLNQRSYVRIFYPAENFPACPWPVDVPHCCEDVAAAARTLVLAEIAAWEAFCEGGEEFAECPVAGG